MAKSPINYEIKLDVSQAIEELKKLKWEVNRVSREYNRFKLGRFLMRFDTIYFTGVITGIISALIAAYIFYN